MLLIVIFEQTSIHPLQVLFGIDPLGKFHPQNSLTNIPKVFLKLLP